MIALIHSSRPRPPAGRLWRVALLGLIVVPALVAMTVSTQGCGDTEPDPESLFAPGPYAAGFRQSTLTYPRAVTGEDRSLPLSVWYPAPADSTEGFARYTTGGIISVFSELALSSPAVAPGGPFPVVIYSHGGGGEAQHIYPIAELMASHGFIVIAADHIGTTTLDTGDRAAPVARWSVDRPNDITATLDWLEAPTDDALRDQARTDGVMLIGYSLGGYTGYASIGVDPDIDRVRGRCGGPSCALFDDPDVIAAFNAGFGDSRITAAVLQAAVVDMVADGELEANEVPLLFQTGADDIDVPSSMADIAWARSNGADDLWLDMPDGGHLSFIPSCDDVPRDLLLLIRPRAETNGCGADALPVADALDGQAGYAHMFARVHLLGESQWSTFLQGPSLRDGFTVEER